MSRKRPRQEAMDEDNKSASPFMPMFEQFRAELDQHHDRRERVIKASRDITAASKKIIFGLQRVRKLNEPVPQHVAKGNAQYYQTIQTKLAEIAPDLQGINAYRYGRQISWGLQEYMEATTFQYYLETQKLITHEDAQRHVTAAASEQKILLTIDDYILGIFDMVGEVMRFAITAMATTGELPGRNGQNVLADLRELRACLERLEAGKGTWFGNDVSKKMPVMQECVEKVEKALYGLTVRGAERPKGWMPDMDGSRGREEIEGF